MQVLELMKTHVVKTTPDATLSEAVDLMDIYQVSGLPVVDSAGLLCGVITERDILRALYPTGVNELRDLKAEGAILDTGQISAIGNVLVNNWMTKPPVYVREDTDLSEAGLVLLRNGLKRLPVVSVEGQVIGTLNRIDVFQALFEGNL